MLYIKNFKTTTVLNNGLILKNINKIIKIKRKAQLKPCTDMNTNLRTEAIFDFEKTSFLT